MYCEIVIKWFKKSKKVTLPPLKDKQSLTNILKKLFGFKDEQIIGITNSKSKFYDMESFTSNLQSFDKQTIELVTSTVVNNNEQAFPQIEDQNEFNIQPISFASNTPNQFENDYNPLNNDSQLYEHVQFPEEPESEVIAEIHDLKMFEQMFLDDEITIIVESSKRLDHLSFPHYHLKGKNKKIYIYQNHKKICQLPILVDNWKETQNIVLNVLKSFEDGYKNLQQSQKESNEANFFSTQPQIDLIYERRKSHPSQQKKRTSRNNSKRESKENTKGAFQKQKKQQERKYDFFPKKQSRSEQSQEPQRYEIPIIIRKSNNQIEKVTASYPLSHDQMQAINSLLQLEIQGLFTDEEINKVKMMVLGENDAVLKIFDTYSKQKMNVGELSKSLALVVRKKQSLRR